MDIKTLQWSEGRTLGDIKDIDECKEAMTALSVRIADIQGQITNAKILAASADQYSDRIWWRKVNAALALNKAGRQYLQDLAGKMRRTYTSALKASRDQRLIDALRAHVGESAFLTIAAEIDGRE